MADNGDTPTTSTKHVFTTGEAAEICKVSQQTIIRCFDRGRLNGFRVPGSRFRRIPREDLIRFMQENDIPTSPLQSDNCKILIVDHDHQIAEMFLDLQDYGNRFEIQTVSTGYEAGILTEKFRPDLMILDYTLPYLNGNIVCKTVRENPNVSLMRIVIASDVVNQPQIDDLLLSGADAFLKKPFNNQDLMQQIATMLKR